jgi:hypothetical protein
MSWVKGMQSIGTMAIMLCIHSFPELFTKLRVYELDNASNSISAVNAEVAGFNAVHTPCYRTQGCIDIG